MYGTIQFHSIEQMATFLAEFTGKSTALFTVTENNHGWLLTFTGGF